MDNTPHQQSSGDDTRNFMADASEVYDRWYNYHASGSDHHATRRRAVVGVLLDLETLARTIEQVEGATLMGAPAEVVALLRSFVAQQSAMLGESSELDVPQLYDRLCAWRRAQTVERLASGGPQVTSGYRTVEENDRVKEFSAALPSEHDPDVLAEYRRGHASAGAAPGRVTPPPPSTPQAPPPDRTA